MPSPEFLAARERHLRLTGQERLIAQPPAPKTHEPRFDPDELRGVAYLDWLAEHEAEHVDA